MILKLIMSFMTEKARAVMLLSFVDLYSYVRLSRVMNEKYEDEPEWMQNLRKRLQEKIARIKESYSVWD